MISKLHVIALVGGCGAAACNTQPTCVEEAVFPIAVTVTDSVTGASLAEVTRGVAAGREATDSLKLIQGPAPLLVGGVGKGPFEVRLAAPGYQDWSRGGIEVSFQGDRCPVPVTQHVEARLQPESPGDG